MWSNIKWRIGTILLVATGAIFGIVTALKAHDSPAPPLPAIHRNLKVGDIFPASVELIQVDGKKIHASDFPKHALLINFWAAWCGPCLHEMPSLVAAQKEYGGRGLNVLAIDMDDNATEGAQELRKKFSDMPLKIFQGVDSQVLSLFDISGVPFTVLVDKGGTIRFAGAGEADWMSQEMRSTIEATL